MTRSRQRRRVPTLIAGGVAVLAAMSVYCACNYHWEVFPTNFELRRLHIISVVPAVAGAGGEYVPVCSNDQVPDAVLLHLSLLGNQETMSSDGLNDRDQSIRPGDMVQLAPDPNFPSDRVQLAIAAEGDTIGKQHFIQDITCMEPYSESNSPSPDVCSGTPPAGSGVNPSWVKYVSDFTPTADGYYHRTFMEDGKIGVAILIDQSGSMKGLVDKHTFKEVEYKEGQILWNTPTWEPDGSDPKGQHINAVEHFLNALNPREKSIVFQFGGETGQKIQPVCWNPDGLEGTPLLRHCYSTDRGLILDAHPSFNHTTAELAKLVNGGQGRTPLWQAVLDAYTFMTTAPDTESRHLVVIGDGPDTCSPESPDFLPVVVRDKADGSPEYIHQGPCSSVGYAQVKAQILKDLADPVVPKVHIDFVQFQAPGYKDRDPRQQELACLTGGNYIFVNSESIPKEDKDAPAEEANPITGKYLYPALETAIMKVRYALAGDWQMAIDLPGLATMTKGAEIALKGNIKLQVMKQGCPTPPCGITSKDMLVNLGFGLTGTQYDEELALVDVRPVFRLPCTSVGECDWYGPTADECADTACLDTDLLCGAAAKDDDTDCTIEAKPGTCCAGTCFEKDILGGTCAGN
ncbi:MAG: hypothetical protein GXP54_13870 [Deltaproteobacteria bacterium]|nr:hypothetical protein [Deltaproteobacteria bacterium]